MEPGQNVDVELVARVRASDRDAWVALTDRHTNLLWAVARSLRLNDEDAADAVQTTWLRLVERLDDLRDPARVASWLATTMRRECLAALRRNSRTLPAEGWDDRPDGADPPDEALLREERDADLWRAFAGLRPNCRALLRLLMADPPPRYAEVAAALDIPIGSIGPTRRRCLDDLREILRSAAETPDAGTRAVRGEQR